MQTIEITIQIADDLQEYLIAELSDLDFGSFVQEEDALKAYIPGSRWDDTRREFIEKWMASAGHPQPLVERVIEPENWNQKWEETIKPVAVGPFLIKPTWADIPTEYENLILLEIDPKMSFGTGYHESTRLMLHLLPRHLRRDARVLDCGTGTGVLAIAALRLGAAGAIAFDTDEWAQQNCVENFYLNNVQEDAEFRPGSMEVVPEAGFDMILANIERKTLLEMMPGFAARSKAGGILMLAGLLVSDRLLILNKASQHGFLQVDEAQENDWWAVVLKSRDRNQRQGASSLNHRHD